ncbi:MAG: MBL fold metallo-hydrolase [Desulfatibacillum sp.]|nr:MBL fold metallo-hydrolase [Desulfatibacillum sp.]
MMQNKPGRKLDVGLRILGGWVGLNFLALGIGFLTLSEVFATAFFMEPARAVGINALRGDMGALFLGMSLFCMLGVVTVHRRLLLIPIVFLSLIIVGRLTSVLMDDVPLVAGDALIAEFIMLGILLAAMFFTSGPAGQNYPPVTARSIFRQPIMVGLVLVLVAIVGIFASQRQIGMTLVRVIGKQLSSQDVLADLPDGLHVVMAGSGSPLPDSKRVQPCLAVIAGKAMYIVDSGPGSTLRLELMKLRLGDLKGVLLTHFHSDHIGDLGELILKRWANGANREPLEIFGPPGVETVMQGFNLAYSLDSQYRVAHHGPETVPPSGMGGVARPFSFPEGKEELVVIDADGLQITAFVVDHRPVEPAVGYRFDYKGRSLVISGDTLPCDSLRRQAAGADLLLHEALQPTMVRALSNVNREIGRTNVANISTDILDYHTFTEEAARIAQEAGVRRLVLYHTLPPLPVSVADKTFLGDAKKHYSGPIMVAVDGLGFSLPADNHKIVKKWFW